jgi:CRP-like cAMP-binding protein
VTARAEAASELVLLTRKDFHAVIDLDPRLGVRILMAVAKLLAMRVRAYAPKLKDTLLE